MKRRAFLFIKFFFLIPFLLCSMGQQKETEYKNVDNVVTVMTSSIFINKEWFLSMNRSFEEETGLRVQIEVIPSSLSEAFNKINIEILTGSDIDVIQQFETNQEQLRYEAGFFMSLDHFLDMYDYDAEKKFGEFLAVKDDGEIYSLPIKQEIWVVFYNKKIFDEADVPYPEAPWTWDDYLETAKKLTNPEKSIWGSYMIRDNILWDFIARQKGVPAYTKEGFSNFEDPAFAESFQYYYNLGYVDKVQPDLNVLSVKNLNWDYFASTDNIGMHFMGNWYLRLLTDLNDYPRDWDFGVVASPVPDYESNNSLVEIVSCSINKNAQHPENAFLYISWLAENQYKYENVFPARVDLSSEEEEEIFQSIVEKSGNSITTEELNRAFFNNGMGFKTAKIEGILGHEYSSIIEREAIAFLSDTQTLEEAISSVKKNADRAILQKMSEQLKQ